MSKQQNGHFIMNPLTNKKLSVGRDLHRALTEIQRINTAKQKELQTRIADIAKAMEDINYTGNTADMNISVNFTKEGKINPFTSKVEFKGALDGLSDEAKQAVRTALNQYELCINQALSDKTTESQDNIKRELETAA